MNGKNSLMSNPNSRQEKHGIPANPAESFVDFTPTAEQQMSQSLEKVQDSYCFQCGKTPVHVCFSSEGKELGQILKSYFLSRKR